MKKHQISIKFGVLTAIILIVYFLLLGLLGVNSNPFYSLMNVLITTSGLALAIRELEEKSTEKINYKEGFEVSFFAGIIATILFSIFFITYYVYTPGFSEDLQEKIGKYANTGGIFITVATMGGLTSLVVSFALMQLHKNRLYKKQKH